MSSLRRKFVVILSRTVNFVAWSVGCFLLGVGVMGYYRVIESGKALKALHIKQQPFTLDKVALLVNEAQRRAELYDEFIVDKHLVNNMVVNRRLPDWHMEEQCDSLLFSSLRFIALKKLGLEARAAQAWQGIRQVVRGQTVMRHPQCYKPPSRDMILGLLGALAFQPEDGKQVFIQLMQILERNSGFFSQEKTHYSFLTPQIAQLARYVSKIYDLPEKYLPMRVVRGYSTHEIESLIVDGGYRAHLIALTVWLELDLLNRQHFSKQILASKSIAKMVDKYSERVKKGEFELERLQFVTQRLVDLDPNNLFFRWLRLKTAGVLEESGPIQRMLHELVNMPQFPKGALPMNCDRDSDYVWMRHTSEALEKSSECTEQFPGIDFLWMTALLLEDLKSVK